MVIQAPGVGPAVLTPPSPSPSRRHAADAIGQAQHHEASLLRFAAPMPLLPQLLRPEQLQSWRASP
ncbi:MAG: hypothetical protein NT053_14765 [Cyanobacteria bacterium]|nr:hypothetical protein [Cyanobacteriota bacterium]